MRSSPGPLASRRVRARSITGRRTPTAWVLPALAALATVGCGLDETGNGGFDDGRDGGLGAEGAAPPGRGDASTTPGFDADVVDVAVPPPSPPSPDARPACLPSGAEVCDDGVDNDCNGVADCADPACSPAFACYATPPFGWVLTAFAPTTHPTCDPSYRDAIDVVEDPSGPAARCTCSCTADPSNTGSCSAGAVALTPSTDAACRTASVPRYLDASKGACTPLPQPLNAGNIAALRAAGPVYVPGTCTTTPAQTIPPLTYGGVGRVCTGTPNAGGGCGASALCAPTISSSFSACIMHASNVSCPTGYTQRHVIGTKANDDRRCNACTCIETGVCTTSSVDLFAASDCSAPQDGTGVASVGADAKCTPLSSSGDGKFVAYRFKAQVTPFGCSALPGSAAGGVSIADPATVCCP